MLVVARVLWAALGLSIIGVALVGRRMVTRAGIVVCCHCDLILESAK